MSVVDDRCDICEDGEEECGGCLGDDSYDCYSCNGSGYRVPEHCCACGGSPYCQCCRRCGASCMGSCRCPVTITLQDGRTLDLPPPDEERDHHQEHKDDVAMGQIHRDGSPREPDPEDYLAGESR